jgi:hypothetical protein
MRGLIQNQRYSINGMPCLYLGTSSYVCWEELGRPSFNDFWVSRFEVVNNQLRILNLSSTLQEIYSLDEEDKNTEQLINYFLFWIIQCACSISVKNKNRVFREEYIIPQLIMQNIRKSHIDGVMYFSVRGSYDKAYNSWIMKNFAFPADDYNVFSSEGDMPQFNKDTFKKYKLSTKLTKSFSLTDPLNMGLVEIVESDNAFAKTYKKQQFLSRKESTESLPGYTNLNRNKSMILLSENYKLPYEYTKFYELESGLDYMQATVLS